MLFWNNFTGLFEPSNRKPIAARLQGEEGEFLEDAHPGWLRRYHLFCFGLAFEFVMVFVEMTSLWERTAWTWMEYCLQKLNVIKC